ncbi:fructosamine kinase family protein [Flammeovirga sp. MY04]|uniref:fructosamine kinase family protein n=1 Tax=Flammeovirga sp. MY04 TaxID=1191459 RepID=UPI00080621CF|nr:fructosamine kinase family protein [Flammeovirga sp. MY04]ANQ49779.1 fructosamine kinase family protein [Flammeovirga sp. MY04]
MSEAFYQEILKKHLGNDIQLLETNNITGGCINESIKLSTNKGNFFIKHNAKLKTHFFDVERKGLNLIRDNSDFTVPKVIGIGEFEHGVYLIMEHINSSRSSHDYWEKMGNYLAEMHKVTQPEFGLNYHNYIGRLPQLNNKEEKWIDFFVNQRIVPQYEMSVQNGFLKQHHLDKIYLIKEKLENYFPKESPALLHGDLWSGNTMVGALGEPCLIDPAVYYGHREAELAFTTLFGGFDDAFFNAYNETYPWEEGIKERIPFYNLYPLLVHLNLFGKSYLSEIEGVLNKLEEI